MNTCNAEHQQLVDDCANRLQHLDEWEREFLQSLQARLASGRPLSERQAERLDQLWERVTTKGCIR